MCPIYTAGEKIKLGFSYQSFAKEIGGQELADIENPFFVGCEDWLYSLAYQQFTPEEISNGKAVEILMDKGIL